MTVIWSICVPFSHSTPLELDPEKGPQTQNWKQYDPNDTTSLALLGNSLTGAELGDHFTADSSCDFWNEVVPIFPEVGSFVEMISVYVWTRC